MAITIAITPRSGPLLIFKMSSDQDWVRLICSECGATFTGGGVGNRLGLPKHEEWWDQQHWQHLEEHLAEQEAGT